MRAHHIAELQVLLNRIGGLLDVDGRLGPQTRRAVRDARALAGLPPGDRAGPALLAWLRAQPEPSPDLPAEGVRFIAREEVGSRDRYQPRPVWPGGESGITIGVGYDLRFAAGIFEADWGKRLPAEALAALRPHLGRRGTEAAAAALSHVRIPWSAAWQAFVGRSLPQHVGRTARLYPALAELPGLCRAVLVSLVYNRGTGLAGRSRQEMRGIRDLLARGRPEGVPTQLLSMRRLWPHVPGLQARREREAALWQEGLRSPA